MPLSKKKKALLEIKKRQDEVNRRSLNGKGYFMDAYDDDYARIYVRTGDQEVLNRLPDYSKQRSSR